MVGTSAGKRLGILGIDRVGQVVAKRARGFDANIHYHDVRRLPPERSGRHLPRDGGRPAPRCDFLSVHCNVTPATRRHGRQAVQPPARRRDLRQRGRGAPSWRGLSSVAV
jgi:lactate dehydrogenase-like 2-hydroxyacid dehydrogenase